jgi:signal-transduction protein with cAMP-binding, CBS, and nucleotidyltransferase domain
MEETACYIQQKEDFLPMVQRHPFFLEFFNRLLTQRMRSIYKEVLIETPGVSQVEPFLFTKQIKEMISSLEKELRNHLNSLIQQNPSFLSLIAEGVLDMGIPLGFFKNFIVEKSGSHKDTLNIKLSGLVPLTPVSKFWLSASVWPKPIPWRGLKGLAGRKSSPWIRLKF